MAKIQVLDLDLVEAPIEDLSNEMTSHIQGGGLSEDIRNLIDETIDEVRELIAEIRALLG